MSKTSKYWVWSFAIAILFIAVHGYQFNSSDQEEHLPQVYKLHDTSLYKGDYVVESLLNEFSIRFFYVRVIYLVSLLLPVSTACFVLYLILLTVTACFVIRLAHLFLNSGFAAVATGLLSLVVLNNFTVGGNGIEDNLLTCTVFANAACIAAWYYLFKKNLVTAFALAGVASLFQLLMGLHVFLLMTAIVFFTEAEKKFKKTISSSIIYILFASPMLVPICYRQFFMNASSGDDLFYYALYVYRNPHHYIPSFFPVKDYLKIGMLLVTSVITVLILKPKWAKDFFIIAVLIVAGMLVYFILLEKYNLLFIGKLQWFKTCTWLTVFCSIALCSWLVHIPLLQKQSYAKLLSKVVFTLSCVALIAILNSKYLPFEKLKHKYKVGNYSKSDLTIMHEWINNNIEKDAMFVTLPTDDSFLCEAKHPLIIGYKAIIHEPWFMVQWYIEFIYTYHLHDNVKWEMKLVLDNADHSYNIYNNTTYFKHKGVKYRIDDLSKCSYLNTLPKPIFKSGNYVLIAL